MLNGIFLNESLLFNNKEFINTKKEISTKVLNTIKNSKLYKDVKMDKDFKLILKPNLSDDVLKDKVEVTNKDYSISNKGYSTLKNAVKSSLSNIIDSKEESYQYGKISEFLIKMNDTKNIKIKVLEHVGLWEITLSYTQTNKNKLE